MAKAKRHPLEVKLSDDQRRDLTTRLCEEIRAGKRARSTHIDDHGLIDFAYSLYEQQSQKGISRDTTRYGQADLTSPIGTENVDVLTSRTVQSIFRQEPLWIVEGIGQEHEQKAPVVEAFMQVTQEQMRLQKVLRRAVTAAYVETGSILEVCERTQPVTKHEVIKAQIATDEFGAILLDENGKPIPAVDPATGDPIEAPQGSESFVEVAYTYQDYTRTGAYVRRRSMKDFLVFPAHAEDDEDVWGRATRYYLRSDEIERKVQAGEFGQAAVQQLDTETQEREQTPEMDRAGISVETVYGFQSTENEVWRVECFLDFGEGQTFCVAHVSERHDVLLSLRHDWLGRWRTVYLNPYPSPCSWFGYSLILTKLLTTIEEHTAWRNMNADKETLAANAPLKVRRGSGFDPELQAFGAGTTITLDNLNDLEPMVFPSISAPASAKEQQCTIDAQRIVGVNDIALAQNTAESRTLGENRMVAAASFVRTDDPIANIQEALEEAGEIIHAIAVQTLKERDGVPMPGPVAERLTQGHPNIQRIFTADMIAGQYRFKPRGSSDQADPNRRQQVFINGMAQLANWAKVNPHIAARMATPDFAQALMQWFVSEFKPRDSKPFLTPAPMPMLPGMPPGPGGMPGGEAPSFGGPDVLNELLSSLGPGAMQ